MEVERPARLPSASKITATTNPVLTNPVSTNPVSNGAHAPLRLNLEEKRATPADFTPASNASGGRSRAYFSETPRANPLHNHHPEPPAVRRIT
eukprot:4418481-Pyramimonas_sp.AAC.1